MFAPEFVWVCVCEIAFFGFGTVYLMAQVCVCCNVCVCVCVLMWLRCLCLVVTFLLNCSPCGRETLMPTPAASQPPIAQRCRRCPRCARDHDVLLKCDCRDATIRRRALRTRFGVYDAPNTTNNDCTTSSWVVICDCKRIRACFQHEYALDPWKPLYHCIGPCFLGPRFCSFPWPRILSGLSQKCELGKNRNSDLLFNSNCGTHYRPRQRW